MSWGIAFRLGQRLKGSLYVLPALGALLGPLLGQLTLWLDRTIQLPPAWQYSAATATSVLSVLVGAMVALLGFVVTIGVLVVQQATSTLSPRFMRLWYRDLLQKVLLATFAGTLTFSFSLLRRVEDNSVPHVGVTLAGVLVTASLLLLLLYLDRFTHSLRPVAVAAMVAGTGRRVVEDLPAARGDGDDGGPVERPAGPATVIRAGRAGAIQAVDARGLLAQARRHDCVLVLRHSVGDFVPTGAEPGPGLRAGAARRPAAGAAHARPRAGADHRAGPGLRPAHPGRHRHQGALPGRQRPHHRGPGARLHRGPPAGDRPARGARPAACCATPRAGPGS